VITFGYGKKIKKMKISVFTIDLKSIGRLIVMSYS